MCSPCPLLTIDYALNQGICVLFVSYVWCFECPHLGLS